MKAGVVIMSGFAALWWVWGLAVFSAVPVAVLAPVLVSAVLIGLAIKAPACPPVAGVGRVVGLASAAEGVAILVAVNVLHRAGLAAYLPCATAAIVGLHFLPIARHLQFQPYYWSAGALVTMAALGVATGSMALVCWGAAVILWLTCATVLGQPRGFAAAV